MTYHPVTPFRRAVDAAVLAQAARAEQPLPQIKASKWDILRNLTQARRTYQLSDRALAVLQALLSFHPDTELSADSRNLVVFPSNAALCTRLGGMACSTMRRHLGDLVRAGIIGRRDSPNGKRFARTHGDDVEAYGFDLSPLLRQAEAIHAHAQEVSALQEQMRRLRLTVSVMRRDLAALASFAAEEGADAVVCQQAAETAAQTASLLRRKLTLTDLKDLEADVAASLTALRQILEQIANNMSTSDANNEQHLHNSNTETLESEPCLENQEEQAARGEMEDCRREKTPIPLGMVMRLCGEIQSYASGAIRNWSDFGRLCDEVRPMMGISQDAWQEAQQQMGRAEASVVLAAMLERFSEIRSPGGYLRALARKAAEGAFSSGPMVMALHHRKTA